VGQREKFGGKLVEPKHAQIEKTRLHPGFLGDAMARDSEPVMFVCYL